MMTLIEITIIILTTTVAHLDLQDRRESADAEVIRATKVIMETRATKVIEVISVQPARRETMERKVIKENVETSVL